MRVDEGKAFRSRYILDPKPEHPFFSLFFWVTVVVFLVSWVLRYWPS